MENRFKGPFTASQSLQVPISLKRVYHDFFKFIGVESLEMEEPISHVTRYQIPKKEMTLNMGLRFAIRRQGRGKVVLRLDYCLDTIGGQPIRNYREGRDSNLLNFISKLNSELYFRGHNWYAVCNKRDALVFRFTPNIWLINEHGNERQQLRGMKKALQDAHMLFKGKMFGNFKLIQLILREDMAYYHSMGQLREVSDQSEHEIAGSLQDKQTVDRSLLLLMNRKTTDLQGVTAVNSRNRQIARLHPEVKQPQENSGYIAQTIDIKRESDPQPRLFHRFRENLKLNQIPDTGALTLREVKFQVKGTMSPNRQTNKEQPGYHLDVSDGEMRHENLIFKRCLPVSSPVSSHETESSVLTRSRKDVEGHHHEHYFMTHMANKRCPYIIPLYQDVRDAKKEIQDRSIISKFADGDLFQLINQIHSRMKRFHDRGLYRWCDWPFDRYLSMFEQMVRALLFLHNQGVVHRDMKPTNVLVEHRPPIRLRLVDFGSVYIEGHPKLANIETDKLYSTPGYCIRYNEALTMTNGNIKARYTKGQYQTHQKFDIYGLARTMEDVLEFSEYTNKSLLLNQTLGLCKEVEPDLRPTHKELLNIILELRIREKIGISDEARAFAQSCL